MNIPLNSMLIWDPLESIGDFLASIFYGLFSILYLILDWLQGIFRSLAGMDSLIINGTEINSDGEGYDVVFYLIQQDVVVDTFITMLLFSVLLMIIMTVLALIRNQYKDKQLPVMEIINKSLRGLVGFLLIPIACVAGLAFGNVLLVGIDAATSPNGNSSNMSTTVFMASAYNANVLRQGNKEDALEDLKEDSNIFTNSSAKAILSKESLNDDDYDKLATILDSMVTGGELQIKGKPVTVYSYVNLNYAYDMWQVNYLIMVLGAGTMIGIMIKMSWGLVSRMIKLTLDFILIPVVLSMYPFDDGKAFQSWKGDFVKNVIISYATIGVLNLYYSILPLIGEVKLSSKSFITGAFGAEIVSFLFQCMVSIAGVYTASSLITTIGGWFGAGDLIKEGETLQKNKKEGWGTITGKVGAVGGTIGAYLGGRAAAGQAGKGAWGKLTGGVSSAFKNTKFGEEAKKINMARLINAGRKKGQDSYGDAEGTFDLSAKGLGIKRKQGALAMDKDIAAFLKSTDGMDPETRKILLEESGLLEGVMKSKAFEKENKEIESYRKLSEKAADNSRKISSYVTGKQNYNSYEQSLRSYGIDPDDIKKILAGETIDFGAYEDKNHHKISFSLEQISTLGDLSRGLQSANETMNNAAKEAALAFLKSKGKLGPGFTKENLGEKTIDELRGALDSQFGMLGGVASKQAKKSGESFDAAQALKKGVETKAKHILGAMDEGMANVVKAAGDGTEKDFEKAREKIAEVEQSYGTKK